MAFIPINLDKQSATVICWLKPSKQMIFLNTPRPSFMPVCVTSFCFNLLNAKLNPSCKSQLAEFF